MSPAKKATAGRSGAASKAKKSTAKSSTGKKTGAKKTTARKTTAKKTAVKKTAVRKTAVKKTTATKTAATKTAVKRAPAKNKKVTAKKPAAKKTVTKKTPVKKVAAKSPAAKKVAGKVTPTPMAKAVAPATKKPLTRPAPPAPPKKKVRAAKFTSDQLKKIKGSLLEKRVELEARKKELDESSFDSTQSDITGEVGLDEDFADAGTATFERERDLSIRNNIRDLIDQVTRAVERIDDGVYGTCERCGQPIDATRLRELPHASLCLDCKRREERAR